MIISVLAAMLITACYMIGGQIEKSVRRYGVPTFAFCYAFIADKNNREKDKIKYIFLFAMIGVLSMGYGESSWLRKLCNGSDRLTRVAYALLLSLVFMLAGGNIFICFPVLAVAFSIRAGKLFSIGKFDFLIEDICRGLSIFICTFLTIRGLIW